MSAPTSENDEARHGPFRDLCLLYRDFNRPVFLEEIEWFIWSADKEETAVIRKWVQSRAKNLRGGGKRGRPRARNDRSWVTQTAKYVWQKYVLGWTWAKIAQDAGIEPTREHLWTLQRRKDQYAAMIWRLLPPMPLDWDPKKGPIVSRDWLERALAVPGVQSLLRLELALPFRSHPKESQELVIKLAPRGCDIDSGIFP